MSPHGARRKLHLLCRGLGAAVGNIRANRAREQKWILRDVSELLAECAQWKAADRGAVNGYGSGSRVVEARGKFDESRLARTGGTDECHDFTRRNFEIHAA